MKIEEDGTKRFNGLTFVPKKVESMVITRFHDDIREGHPGIARTMEKDSAKLLLSQECTERSSDT